ncbi:MAG: DNA polymerase III subunit gamma/tau [Clostridia bacterium]|nr:DNA polymerase III subunit gamma/tau [Clostridia bacterium]
MHQALYRKWRPQSFDDVCGQEHITSVLRYEVSNNALSHAYLFCGSRGTGKTTCAKILAKAVNCESPVDGSPCNKCAACRAIDSGAATDVLEMDAASNNGVDNIRDIRDEVAYTPSALRFRVYIVDEVHMLSQSAFNALLKTLEEPPAHVIFILATTELHKLPATIISRCQRFDFRRIALPVLAGRISYIAKQEGMELEPAAAERIARMAQGGMRDAISLLELCGGTRKKIDVATVDDMMGSGGREEMLSVAVAVAESNYDKIFAAIDEAVTSSRDLTVFWQDLIAVYRDILVIKTTADATRYLDLTDAEVEKLKAVADRFKKGTLLAHCRLLEDALFAMQKANAVKRMVAELTLVRMCDPALDTSTESLLSRLERLEDAVAAGVALAPAPRPTRPETTVAAPPVAAEPPSVISEEIPMPDAPPPTESPFAEDPPPKKAAPAAPKTPAPTPKSPATGRVLHRVRGYMNCVERVRRENSMLASFLEDGKLFLDDNGKVVLQLTNPMALMLLEGVADKALLCRAVAPELKKTPKSSDLIIEMPDEQEAARDTVLDDLLEAASDTTPQ